MNFRLMTVLPLAALLMTACGGDANESETGAADTASATPATGMDATTAPPADSAGMAGGMTGSTAPAPGTAVDTAGTGTNPPTAGGQVVEEGATPSPAGTPTAP